MITINPAHLGPDEARQARHLAALARYRALAADFAATGQADRAELAAALDEVARWEPPVEERMRPIREVAELHDVDPATIRRWAAAHQVAAEKRGKLWYVDPHDVELLVATEERRQRGWRLGRKRSK